MVYRVAISCIRVGLVYYSLVRHVPQVSFRFYPPYN